MNSKISKVLELHSGIETLKEVIVEFEGKTDEWEHALCSDWCSDPVMAAYGGLCPCLLAAQISEHTGRSGIASGLCYCPCYPCHFFAFALPQRREIAPKNETLLASYARSFACMLCACGNVQQAKRIGLKVGEFKRRESTPIQMKMGEDAEETEQSTKEAANPVESKDETQQSTKEAANPVESKDETQQCTKEAASPVESTEETDEQSTKEAANPVESTDETDEQSTKEAANPVESTNETDEQSTQEAANPVESTEETDETKETDETQMKQKSGYFFC